MLAWVGWIEIEDKGAPR